MTRIESGALIAANTLLRSKLEIALTVLRFYADQSNMDIVEGRTRIIEHGDLAEAAISQIESQDVDAEAIREMIISVQGDPDDTAHGKSVRYLEG